MDDLLTKLTDAVVGVVATGRVADIIVAIVAEGDIDHTTFSEMLQVGDVAFKGQSVLDAKHDALATLVLVHPEVIRCPRQTEVSAILIDDGLYLIKDEVGIGLRATDIEAHLLGEGLTRLRLRQVAHHDGSVLTAFGHLMKIDQDLRVTMVEVNTLREEHRGVAMGVECQHAVMRMTSLTITASLSHEPLEKRQTVSQAFRMPLHTEDRLILAALDGLNDAVGRFGDDAELAARLLYSLMVEGVDEKPPPCPLL